MKYIAVISLVLFSIDAFAFGGPGNRSRERSCSWSICYNKTPQPSSNIKSIHTVGKSETALNSLKEVEEFYSFYSGWLSGRLEKNENNYRIKDILAEGLYYVLPDGTVLDKKMTLAGSFDAHGSINDLERAFPEDLKVQYSNHEIALITYTEVMKLTNGKTIRTRVVCLFEQNDSAPNKVVWSKMQNTTVEP